MKQFRVLVVTESGAIELPIYEREFDELHEAQVTFSVIKNGLTGHGIVSLSERDHQDNWYKIDEMRGVGNNTYGRTEIHVPGAH